MFNSFNLNFIGSYFTFFHFLAIKVEWASGNVVQIAM